MFLKSYNIINWNFEENQKQFFFTMHVHRVCFEMVCLAIWLIIYEIFKHVVMGIVNLVQCDTHWPLSNVQPNYMENKWKLHMNSSQVSPL
jgi:hypothetical protein